MALYRADLTLPVYLERGRQHTISLPVYDEAGSLVAPDAADTVSVLRPDGTALVDAQTITVSGSIATYAVTATSSETLGEGWQVVWDLTFGSETQRAYKVDAAVVRQHLYLTVANVHLLQRHPELADLYPENETSWDDAISAAWTTARIRLLQNGRRPYLVLSPWALHEAVLCLALANVFRTCSTYTDQEARYTALAAEYQERWRHEWDQVKLTYDNNNDGTPDEGEQGTAAPAVTFLSAPPASAFWDDFEGGY